MLLARAAVGAKGFGASDAHQRALVLPVKGVHFLLRQQRRPLRQRLPPIQRGVRCLPVAAPGTARCPLLVYASSREGAAGCRLDSCQAPETLSQATAALLDAFDARARDGGAAAATAMIGDGTAQGFARSVFGDAVQRLVADASADEEDEEAAAIASWATTAAAFMFHLFFTVAKSGLFIDPRDRNMV